MTSWTCPGAAALLFAAASASPALATTGPACDVTVQELGEARVEGYNALAGGEYLEPIRLRLRNQSDAPCAGRLRIVNIIGGTQLVGLRGRLDYQIVDENSLSTIVFDPVSNQSADIPVLVPARGTLEIRPRLRVPGGQAGRAGHYGALLTARFLPPAGGDGDSKVFAVAAQVVASVQANFVGYAGGASARLDLGELAPGLTRGIGLQIRASDDVALSVNSENDGVLLRESGGGRIPYTMTIGGVPADLARRDEMEVDLADPVQGQTLPVVVAIGAFGNMPVGRYGDVVTFRISAR